MKKEWKLYDRLMRIETGISRTRSLINASPEWWEEKLKVWFNFFKNYFKLWLHSEINELRIICVSCRRIHNMSNLRTQILAYLTWNMLFCFGIMLLLEIRLWICYNFKTIATRMKKIWRVKEIVINQFRWRWDSFS